MTGQNTHIICEETAGDIRDWIQSDIDTEGHVSPWTSAITKKRASVDAAFHDEWGFEGWMGGGPANGTKRLERK